MNPILMNAILSMDSYNRGYGAGLGNNTVGLGGVGSKLGNATVITDSTITPSTANGQAASFYAIAYDYNGATVISYRGTDSALDPITGWPIGGGFLTPSQAKMAFDFYNSVAGGGDPRLANISLTGHSLGGGLAGLVGTVYNKAGLLFDSMAYSAAANGAYEYATTYIPPTIIGGLPDYSQDNARLAFKDSVYGTMTPWDTTAANGSRLTAIELAGQALSGNFAGAPAQLQYTLGYTPTSGGILLPIDLHNMSSLVMAMYAQGTGSAYQNYASPYFWPVLYSDSFASSIGMTSISGTSSASEKLRTIIAYSAIDEGTRVFGDTGIVALYNDANDFGKALSASGANPALSTYAQEISQSFVEYAGMLALHKVELQNLPGTKQVSVPQGMITDTGNALILDYSKAVWDNVLGSGFGGTYSNKILADKIITSNPTEAATAYSWMNTLWGTSNASIFERIILPEKSGAMMDLTTYNLYYSTNKAALYSGTTGDDNLRAGGYNNLIFGGAGNDYLIGGGGANIIFGGDGNDSLYDGTCSSYFNPGTGSYDYINGGMGSGFDYDILDLSYFTTPTRLDVMASTYQSGTNAGGYTRIESVVLGNTNDTIAGDRMGPTATNTYRQIDVDAGGGYDTVDINLDLYITSSGAYLGNIAPDQWYGYEVHITNTENFNLYGQNIFVSSLGHDFTNYYSNNYNVPTISYASLTKGLNFKFQNTGTTIITDGISTDRILNYSKSVSTLFIKGTAYGDTIIGESNVLVDFISGKGNDIANLYRGSYTYTGGNDVIYHTSASTSDVLNLKILTDYSTTVTRTYHILSGTVSGNTYTALISDTDYVVAGYGTILVKETTPFTRVFDMGTNHVFDQTDTIITGSGGGYVLVNTYIGATTSLLNGDIFQNQAIDLSSGTYYMQPNFGNDTYLGTANADYINGWDGNDVIDGKAGNDVIFGGNGNDKIIGGLGTDNISGDAGDDYIIADEYDYINAGLGNDTVNLSSSGIGLWFFIYDSFYPGGNTYIYSDVFYQPGNPLHKNYYGAENFIGTNYDDTYSFYFPTYYNGKYTLDGAGGADTLRLLIRSDDINSHLQSDLLAFYNLTKSGTISSNYFFSDLNLEVKSIEKFQLYVDWNLYNYNPANNNFTGTSVSETLNGNIWDNAITGLGGDDTIYGLAGNDTLNGGTGNDTLFGDIGNDTYLYAMGDGFDLILDSSGAKDVIQFDSSVSSSNVHYTRSGSDLLVYVGSDFIQISNQYAGNGYGLEEIVYSDGTKVSLTGGMTFTGTAYSDSLEGTTQNDILYGLAGNDFLTGWDGNDLLDGGSGNDVLDGVLGDDVLNGGAGNDTYIISSNSGLDIITDASGVDWVSFGTGLNQSTMTMAQDSMNVGDLNIYFSGIKTAVIQNFFVGTGTIENFQFSNGTILNVLTQSFTLNGTSGNDALKGYAGADTIFGGAGDDTLNGGAGADTLIGGLGNDIYIVDNVGDVVTELANEGTDTVQSSVTYTLSANVENLTLTGTAAINGTGNTLNNTITGNTGNNILSGGSGADTMIGGKGNDTYIVDNVGDVVTETASAGTDTVQSSVTYTLSANVENLVLTGTSAINGTGNTLVNTITGNSGDNTLNGGAGADKLIGGTGNDTYIVDNVGDVVTESANAGTDTVQSSVTYTLAANVENLTLTGSSAINGTGNTLANTITGNTGANILKGGDGNDTVYGGAGNDSLYGDNGNDVIYGDSGVDNIWGGAGADSFMFMKASAYSGIDVINDFSLAQSDKINIHDLLIGYDPLTKAITDFVQITTSGTDSILKVDADGGANSFVQIATLKNITGLTDEAALVTSGNLIV